MKLIALIAWYDEPAEWLAETVASLAGCCAHVVAADGAFALFPDAAERPRSSPEQAEAIATAADAAGIGYTLHVRARPWQGEVEKRSTLFRLGAAVAEPYLDWFLILDGDMVVRHADPRLHARLATCGCDVASYQLVWDDHRHATELAAGIADRVPRAGATHVRCLVRALPNLRVRGSHSLYLGDRDGQVVCLRGRQPAELAEAVDVTDELRVEHRHAARPRKRQLAAAAYCSARDRTGLE